MGRADLLIGVSGIGLLVALALGSFAMFLGRRDVALVQVANRAAPLAIRASIDLLPPWKVGALTLRHMLLVAELALFGLILGLGGLAAGVVAALGLWGFSVARAKRIVHTGERGDPVEDGLAAVVSRALLEAGLVAASYALALWVSAALA
nr:hypothetical protein [Brevundimonas diminuta]